MPSRSHSLERLAGIAALVLASHAAADDSRWPAMAPIAHLGPRPFYLVGKMDESPLKRKLEQCSHRPVFVKSDFSIGHRGAPSWQHRWLRSAPSVSAPPSSMPAARASGPPRRSAAPATSHSTSCPAAQRLGAVVQPGRRALLDRERAPLRPAGGLSRRALRASRIRSQPPRDTLAHDGRARGRGREDHRTAHAGAADPRRGRQDHPLELRARRPGRGPRHHHLDSRALGSPDRGHEEPQRRNLLLPVHARCDPERWGHVRHPRRPGEARRCPGNLLRLAGGRRGPSMPTAWGSGSAALHPARESPSSSGTRRFPRAPCRSAAAPDRCGAGRRPPGRRAPRRRRDRR